CGSRIYCLVSALRPPHFGCQRNRHYNSERSGAAIGRCWMPADWAVQSHSLPPWEKEWFHLRRSTFTGCRGAAQATLSASRRLSGYGRSLVLGAAQRQLQHVSFLANISASRFNRTEHAEDAGRFRPAPPLHLLRGYDQRWNTPDHRLLACFPCYVA